MKNVKKIIFFLALFLTFMNHSHAITPTVEYIDGVYSNRIGTTKTYSGQLGYIWIDGKIIYCLDPYRIIGKDYIIDNNYFNNFSKETLDYMNLVSEYARFFVENKNSYYYMAAQELIWEKIIGEGKIYWTTGINGTGDIIDISSVKEEIKNYINNFYTKPSFEGTVIKDTFYNQIVLEDTNNVLYNYEVVNESKNDVFISNNEIYITVLSSDLNKIKLVRKVDKQGNSSYYHSDVSQDLAYLNSDVQIETEIFVQSNNKYSTTLNINVLDEASKQLVNGGVKLKILNLNTNQYVGEYITYNGIFSPPTPFGEGKYRIELIDVPKNYTIDDGLNFEIDEKGPGFGVYQINYYISKAVGKIKINSFKEDKAIYKLHATKNIYNSYNNIIFKKNQLIQNIELSNNETFITDILPFGKYYVLDENENKKYEIDLEYIDPFTKEVIYELDIFDSKEDIIIPDDNEEKPSIEDKEDHIGGEEENPSISDKEDNPEDKDDKPSIDDKEDNPEDKQDTPVIEDKDDLEDKPLQEIDKKPIIDDKEEIVDKDDKPLIEDKEDVISVDKNQNLTTDNISSQQKENQHILPNTFDYILGIKLLLSLWIIIALFLKLRKHEK